MPTIICDWCQYVGQGDSIAERWNDVFKHEKNCELSQAYEEVEIKPDLPLE